MIGDASPPLDEPEVRTLRAPGGRVLPVLDFRAPGPVYGTIIAGHALMADASSLWRPDGPSIVRKLVGMGFRVMVLDLRGHGVSEPSAAQGGAWSFDDLVGDVGRYLALADEVAPGLPRILLGHGLFGAAALAWLGQHPEARVTACVTVATNVWNRRFEPRRSLWWIKRMILEVARLVASILGHVPSKLLRWGTTDEPRRLWADLREWAVRDRWTSRDGRVDYWAGLARVRVPVLAVLSEGDRLRARPLAATRFIAPIARADLVVVGRDDAPGGLVRVRPDHMGLVTAPESVEVWEAIGGWILRRLNR